MASSARFFEVCGGDWHGFGRWRVGMIALVVGVVGGCSDGVRQRDVCRWCLCGGGQVFVAG